MHFTRLGNITLSHWGVDGGWQGLTGIDWGTNTCTKGKRASALASAYLQALVRMKGVRKSWRSRVDAQTSYAETTRQGEPAPPRARVHPRVHPPETAEEEIGTTSNHQSKNALGAQLPRTDASIAQKRKKRLGGRNPCHELRTRLHRIKAKHSPDRSRSQAAISSTSHQSCGISYARRAPPPASPPLPLPPSPPPPRR